jgi:hypothetical protein
MASLLDSEAQFTQRTIGLKLSEELKRSLHRAGLQTFGTFAYAHGQPGQNISDEGFETWVTGQLLTGATLADVAGAKRLLFESQTMVLVSVFASLGLPNVSMRNSALVGWWWGCGRSLAKLEVPLLNFLPFCPVGHSMQSFWQHLFLLDAGFQFGCVGFSVFDFWQMHFSVATVLQ